MSILLPLNIKKILALLLIYITIFFSIYHYTYTYATLQFEIKKLQASHGLAYGQIYYGQNSAYTPSQMSPFLHWWGFPKKFQPFELPMNTQYLNSIRFDPLSDKGEVIIQNMSIVEYDGFQEIIHPINLEKINLNFLHNIKVLEKTETSLHLLTTGKDPYIEISNNLNLVLSKNNYYELFNIGIYSLITLFLFLYLFQGFHSGYLKGDEIILALILIIYSGYTVLFGTQFRMAWLLIETLPYLAIFIVLRQGLGNYLTYIKYMIFILIYLTIIVLFIDYIQDINAFEYYKMIFPNITYAMIISMIFIQKKTFNLHFYKYFLLILTLTIAIGTILLHYFIIRIDTTLAFGYTMAMSDWAQKNYTFWYLFLMWGTISFFNIKDNKKHESAIILFILIISAFSIYTGYSASAKIAFMLSVILYFIFTFIPFNKKTLMIIPFIVSLYIILFPWISDVFVLLGDLHPSLRDREGLFVIYSDMVKHNILFGYGFNNTGSLAPIEYVSPDILKHYADNLFMKGCAPHSLPLLLWLNLGLLAMLPFGLLLYYGTKRLIAKTYNNNNQPALFSLIVSFVIIITFSWGTWQPHALLTFSFFFGMLLLSLNINSL